MSGVRSNGSGRQECRPPEAWWRDEDQIVERPVPPYQQFHEPIRTSWWLEDGLIIASAAILATLALVALMSVVWG